MARKKPISKEILEDMYVNKRMSFFKIAKALGVAQSTISRKLKNFGINIRNTSEAKLPEDFQYPPREELRKMYEEDFLTQQEIADKLGVSSSGIHNLLVKYSINTRDRFKAQRKLNTLGEQIIYRLLCLARVWIQ